MKESSQHRIAMVKVVGDHALDFTSAVYVDLLNALSPQVQEGDWHSNLLVLPFTVTCAVALEATLNDHLVAFFFEQAGEDNYKRISEAYLSMSFRGKLDILVPTLTNGRYLIKTDSTHYQSLAELISTRNELVHSKSFFSKAAKWEGDDESRLVIDKDFQEKMNAKRIRSLTAENCQRFLGALTALSELFLYPLERGELGANALVMLAR